jgi:hypothetical protein
MSWRNGDIVAGHGKYFVHQAPRNKFKDVVILYLPSYIADMNGTKHDK